MKYTYLDNKYGSIKKEEDENLEDYCKFQVELSLHQTTSEFRYTKAKAKL